MSVRTDEGRLVIAVPLPEDIDLDATQIPSSGIMVEIEGIGSLRVKVPGSLSTAVAHAYVILTSKTFISSYWAIELLDIRDTKPFYMKVRLTPKR